MSSSDIMDEKFDEPVVVVDDDGNVEEVIEPRSASSRHSNKSLWSFIIGVIMLIVIIWIAMWLYSMYRKRQMIQNVGEGITHFFGGKDNQSYALPPAGSSMYFPGFAPIIPSSSTTGIFTSGSLPSSTMSPVTIANPQHTLMMPSGPMSPMVTSNNLGENRVHYFHKGTDSKETRHMDKQYEKLMKSCSRDDFRKRYGRIRFSRHDVSKPEGRVAFDQLNLDGWSASKSEFPVCTFGKRGHYEESMIGQGKDGAKDLLRNLTENMQTQKAAPAPYSP